MSDLIEKILNAVSARPQISDGVFRVDNPDHINVLREFMIEKGIPSALAITECNKLMEGKHPERQAYNKDGLLITFPTPKHKQDAMAAGTHFEKDPTKAASNLFSTPETNPSNPKATEPAPTPPPPAAPTSPEAQPAPQPAPAPAVPSPLPAQNPAHQMTPSERAATAVIIKQILRSDDSVLEETSLWLEKNAPDFLVRRFLK
jgi:hypothetical protein